MPTFSYIANNAEGRQVTGRVEASDRDQARLHLQQQGLVDVDLQPADEGMAAGSSQPLSPSQADQVMGQVTMVSGAGLPLADGLRAAADDSDDVRVAGILRRIADETEQGRSLEEILTASDDIFPAHISGLMLAATRIGQLGPALAELVEQQRTSRELRRSIRSAYAYPLLVVCLAMAVLLFVIGYTSGIYQTLFDDFGVQLPAITQVLFWWRDTGIWVIAGVAAVAALVGLIIRLRIGPAAWMRFMSTIPLVGPLWHWMALAEWSGLLSLLLKHEIPLPQALRLAAGAAGNAHVARVSLRLSDAVGQGQSVTRAVFSTAEIPCSAVPLVRWGEENSMLWQAFATVREMLNHRARARALILQNVLPAALFIAIACTVVFVLGALIAPLGNLVSGLS